MKKIISVITVLALIITAFSFCASAATGKGNEYPIILVLGRGASTPYYSDDGEQIFPVNADKDFIIEGVKECLPYLGKGLITGDLEPWAEKVAEFMAPLYADLIPDKDGNVSGGPKIINGFGHPLSAGNSWYDYTFNYDWRLDTTQSAKYLDEYVTQIKEATGCEKVSLVGRCYGANVVAAYLYEYGHDDIDTAVFYCSTALGCYASGCLFGGDIEVSPKVLESFLEGQALFDDPVIDEFFRATVAFLNTFHGIDGLTDFVNLFVKKVFPALAPKIVPISYGSMPCFWSMVDDGHYEKAKSIIYNGQEEEYADIIKLIDHYHYDIAAGLPKLLTDFAEEGLNVAVISKYGRDALYPIYGNGNPQSDDTVEVPLSSFGAFSSEYGKTLPDKYIESADMKYISSDHCIDASTALFKDSTWFIKGIEHLIFPVSIDRLIATICNCDGQMTVFDDEKYPQFMEYDYSSALISPLDDEPENNSGDFLSEFFSALKRFLSSFLEIVKMLSEKVKVQT